MSENKKGIVMEGGAMRGMFTAGVIDVLMENNITFDGGIGVSAGATFGCNLKSKQIGRVIRYNVNLAHDKRYCSFLSLIKTGDLYGADFCYNILPNQIDVFDRVEYCSNPMEFYVVVSDCVTGQPMYKKLENCNDTELQWMRGSASMPLASKVVEVEGYKLLDGGMTDSLPIKHFESLGYNKNLVVLTQPRDYRKKPNKLFWIMKIALKKYPKLLAAMEKRPETYNSSKDYIFEKADKGELLVICPEKKLDMSRVEHNPKKLREAYNQGRMLAKTRIQEIRDFLSDQPKQTDQSAE